MIQSSRERQDFYCGHQIDGHFVPTGNGVFTWSFEITRGDEPIFTLEAAAPWPILVERGLEREQAIEEVQHEGLHRVRGRLSLGWFEVGKHYQHILSEDAEQVSPPLFGPGKLPFSSEEERAMYYLLQALCHIRSEYPASYKSVDFDWQGVCIVIQVSIKAGLSALDMLDEEGLVQGVHWIQTVIVGEHKPEGHIYVNNHGISHYRELERRVLDRAQEFTMPDIIGNAVLILRCMVEAGAIGRSVIAPEELRGSSGLSDQDYDRADEFLRRQRYVEAAQEPAGKRWVTPLGVEFLEEQVRAGRIQLSLLAEKIARFLFSEGKTHYEASLPRIQETLGCDERACQEAARELMDEGLAEDTLKAGNVSRIMQVGLTAKGRRTVRNNFVREMAPVLQQNVGAIFYDSVSDSNILAVAQAHESKVKQTIETGDADALQAEIGELLERIVEAVKIELTGDQLAVYAGAAKELRSEAAKGRPDSSVIHKCLNALNFAGDLDGTIELGRKAMELSLKVAPLVTLLSHAIVAFLEHLPGA